MPLLNRFRIAFHPLLDPTAALGIGNVHEISTDAAAIVMACLAADVTLNPQIGMVPAFEKAERIKIRLEVSPSAEKVKNALTLFNRDFEKACTCWPGLAGSSSHDFCH